MDFFSFKTKPKCFRWNIRVSLDTRISSIAWPIIRISFKYILSKYLSSSVHALVFSAIWYSFLALVSILNISRETLKDSLTMKTKHSSLMKDKVKLKHKHFSYPARTCNFSPIVIRGGKTNLPF